MRGTLKAQYQLTGEDITDDDFLRAVHDILALQSSSPGKLPCTLLVFDELQQFIAEDPIRTLQLQNIVEACSSRFGSRLLLLGTGQAALQATPQLSKLQGRFTVRVMLSDTDVEKVVREVVLRKAPEKHGRQSVVSRQLLPPTLRQLFRKRGERGKRVVTHGPVRALGAGYEDCR